MIVPIAEISFIISVLAFIILAYVVISLKNAFKVFTKIKNYRGTKESILQDKLGKLEFATISKRIDALMKAQGITAKDLNAGEEEFSFLTPLLGFDVAKVQAGDLGEIQKAMNSPIGKQLLGKNKNKPNERVLGYT